MVSQRRYASRRHWVSQSGSPFLAEMKRTISSFRPFGALSDWISVTKPYLYWLTSIERTRSTVSWTAAIGTSPRLGGFKDRGWGSKLAGFPVRPQGCGTPPLYCDRLDQLQTPRNSSDGSRGASPAPRCREPRPSTPPREKRAPPRDCAP